MKKFTAAVLSAVLVIGSASLCTAGDMNLDVEKIAKKGCACHNKKGDLDGKPAADLIKRMVEFKAGAGKPQLMQRVMKKYDEEQIKALADYYSGK
ncbi:MAG: c-type cytochrome [Desulfovibrio sp.]